MPSYWRSKKKAAVNDFAYHVTFVAILHHVLHSTNDPGNSDNPDNGSGNTRPIGDDENVRQ